MEPLAAAWMGSLSLLRGLDQLDELIMPMGWPLIHEVERCLISPGNDSVLGQLHCRVLFTNADELQRQIRKRGEAGWTKKEWVGFLKTKLETWRKEFVNLKKWVDTNRDMDFRGEEYGLYEQRVEEIRERLLSISNTLTVPFNDVDEYDGLSVQVRVRMLAAVCQWAVRENGTVVDVLHDVSLTDGFRTEAIGMDHMGRMCYWFGDVAPFRIYYESAEEDLLQDALPGIGDVGTSARAEVMVDGQNGQRAVADAEYGQESVKDDAEMISELAIGKGEKTNIKEAAQTTVAEAPQTTTKEAVQTTVEEAVQTTTTSTPIIAEQAAAFDEDVIIPRERRQVPPRKASGKEKLKEMFLAEQTQAFKKKQSVAAAAASAAPPPPSSLKKNKGKAVDNSITMPRSWKLACHDFETLQAFVKKMESKILPKPFISELHRILGLAPQINVELVEAREEADRLVIKRLKQAEDRRRKSAWVSMTQEERNITMGFESVRRSARVASLPTKTFKEGEWNGSGGSGEGGSDDDDDDDVSVRGGMQTHKRARRWDGPPDRSAPEGARRSSRLMGNFYGGNVLSAADSAGNNEVDESSPKDGTAAASNTMKDWSCATCLHANSPESSYCARCTLAAPFFKPWTCAQCSYENSMGSVCGMCGDPTKGGEQNSEQSPQARREHQEGEGQQVEEQDASGENRQ